MVLNQAKKFLLLLFPLQIIPFLSWGLLAMFFASLDYACVEGWGKEKKSPIQIGLVLSRLSRMRAQFAMRSKKATCFIEKNPGFQFKQCLLKCGMHKNYLENLLKHRFHLVV
jgi:hypothetical protein